MISISSNGFILTLHSATLDSFQWTHLPTSTCYRISISKWDRSWSTESSQSHYSFSKCIVHTSLHSISTVPEDLCWNFQWTISECWSVSECSIASSSSPKVIDNKYSNVDFILLGILLTNEYDLLHPLLLFIAIEEVALHLLIVLLQ